jgi:hypothetical protein
VAQFHPDKARGDAALVAGLLAVAQTLAEFKRLLVRFYARAGRLRVDGKKQVILDLIRINEARAGPDSLT